MSINRSKEHDPRMWRRWEQSRAIGRVIPITHEQPSPINLASVYYGKDLAEIKSINTTPEQRFYPTNPGVLIKPRKNIWGMQEQERRAFLDHFTHAVVVGYESSGKSDPYVQAMVTKADSDLEAMKRDGTIPPELAPPSRSDNRGSHPIALVRLSSILSTGLQNAMNHPHEFTTGMNNWGVSDIQGNPVVSAGFDYGDWTAGPGQLELSTMWWKSGITVVSLRDGSFVVNAGETRQRAIAEYFRDLPDYFSQKIGQPERVVEKGFGEFGLSLAQPYSDEGTHGIVDVSDLNTVFGDISERFGLVHEPLKAETELLPLDLDGKKNPLPRTSLTGGRLVTPDGKIAIVTHVSANNSPSYEDDKGGHGPYLYNIKDRRPDDRKDQQYFNPTFVEIGDGKYLYVPQMPSKVLQKGVHLTRLPLDVRIEATYTNPKDKPRKRDSRYDCTTDMWNPEHVDLLTGVSEALKEHFKAAA